MTEYEPGQRVAILRESPLTKEVQIIEAIIVRLLDEERALLRFGSGDEVAFPLTSLTPVPEPEG